jgi:general secretion pathway protein A
MTGVYSAHFGLAAEPFSLSPDPAFLYQSPAHGEALAALRVALVGRRGLAAMTGEVGTGKTTLLYALLRDLGPGVRTAYLANTRLSFVELLQQALRDFDVSVATRNRVALLEALEGFLRRCDADGAIAALVIDEAQNLDADTFEQLRLLTNFETYSAKLLQIVLVGQPELAAILRRSQLRQVNERIAHRCTLAPLSRRQARHYVAHRLRCAGGSLALFSRPALAILLGAAAGVPRRLNVLCHTALLFAFGRGATRVRACHARAAIREQRRGGIRLARPLWRAAGLAVASVMAVSGVAAGWAHFGLATAPPAPPAVVAAPPAAPPPAVVLPAAARPVGPANAAPQLVAPALAAPTLERSAGQTLIVVGKGQTLTDIARRFYGDARPATVRRIRAANRGLRDVDRITAGQVLRLPDAGAPTREGTPG